MKRILPILFSVIFILILGLVISTLTSPKAFAGCVNESQGEDNDHWCRNHVTGNRDYCDNKGQGTCVECRTNDHCTGTDVCNNNNRCVPPATAPPPQPPLYQRVCPAGVVQLIIMIDMSNSMKGDLAQAKAAAKQLITVLSQNPGNAIGLAGFDYNTKTAGTHGLVDGIHYPNIGGYQSLINTIDSMAVAKNQPNGTCIECGMLDARDYFQYAIDNGLFPGQKRVVVVLSDGDANRWVTPNERWVVSGGNANDMERGRKQAYSQAVALRNNMGVEFWTVAFPGADNNDGEKFMHDLAFNLGVEGYFKSGASGWLNYFDYISKMLLGGSVTGVVYNDANKNGVNNGESPRISQQIQLLNASRQVQQSTNTLDTGSYAFSGICPGTYYVKPSLPDPQWRVSQPATGEYQLVNPPPGLKNYDFGMYRIPNTVGTISGSIFLDNDINGRFTPPTDQLYTNAITLSSTLGNKTVTTGTYAYQNIPVNAPGNRYTFTLQLPAGFRSIFPFNSAYSAGIYSDGTCLLTPTNGQANCFNSILSNLNFGITNIFPWIQTVDSHIRNDQSSVQNIIPSTSACGNVTIRNGSGGTAGIVFSTAGTPTFGSGKASAANWIVTGSSNRYTSPLADSSLRTSYDAMTRTLEQNKKTILPLPCSSSTCTITNTSLQSEPYYFAGDLNLGAVTLANKKVVILVERNVNLTDSITVAPGAFLLVIAKGDIRIRSSVGTTTHSCPGTTAQLQGIFSADGNVTIEGQQNCLTGGDRQLHMAGNIIINADQTGGGSFTNNRSLCGDDRRFPVFSLTPRPDFLLNAPSYLLRSGQFWQEAAP